MPKLKITPVNIEEATTASKMAKNISSVVDFQSRFAADLNRVLAEINEVLPTISKPFDDSKLKESVALTSKRLNAAVTAMEKVGAAAEKYTDKKIAAIEVYDDSDLKSHIDKGLSEIELYDDSELASKVKALESKPEPTPFNPSKLLNLIQEQSDSIAELQDKIAQLERAQAANKKEIRSNRQESGLAVDQINQRLNRGNNG